ncbi:hypothetical protein F4780DRAFT_766481 [Xylariomycetidae sp. FL0641]|nr:hypothetical protein F4780DRAFT_766481 [Xylariomycetidae sp. FL0641]
MSSKYSNQRPAGREHIPLYPKGFVAIRIIQLVIAVICLGLCGYGVAVIPFDGVALMLFTAIATMLTSIYILIATFGPPKAYNYWAILALDIFLLIFWLISFVIVALNSAYVFYETASYLDYYYYDDAAESGATLGSVLAAAAALGGIDFILYIVALAIHSVKLHHHRKAGLHCKPLSSSPAEAPEKYQMQPQVPQQTYAGSPPPAQQQVYAAPQPQHGVYEQQVPGGNLYAQAPSTNSGQPVYG